MLTSTLMRWTGPAAMLGGLLYGILSVLEFLSHGPTRENRRAVVLGLISDDYTRLLLIPMVLLLLGVVGLNTHLGVNNTHLRRSGYETAVVGFGMAAIGRGIAYWAFPFVNYADPNFYLTNSARYLTS